MVKSVIFGGGRGFGESILIQYGADDYGIIDSFIDKSGGPLVLDYLLSNNIDFSKVKFVVLTHYHQDHFTGISTILEKCTEAKFYVSNSIRSSTFQFLIAKYVSIPSSYNFFSEFEQIIDIINKSNRKLIVLSEKSQPIVNNQRVKIYSLSPNEATFNFLEDIYKKKAQSIINDKGVKIQIGKDFNFQSVVLVVEIENVKILYGSDLEYSDKPDIGWKIVCRNKKITGKKFNVFKLPHHGSENGCNISDWQTMTVNNPYLKLTPYSRSSKLPKPEMVKKICRFSNESYITSEIKYSKIPSKLKKKLKGLNIRKIKDSKGFVEMNIDSKISTINVVLGGEAKKLSLIFRSKSST